MTLTAVTDENCITVSARPDILASFLATLPENIQIYRTDIDTLYHTSIHETGAKVQVLEDIIRRQIRFPAVRDLKAPLRNSFDGQVVDVNSPTSLDELIVNMIFTLPVNWHEVMASLVTAVPKSAIVHLIHFGPGTGLARSMGRALEEQTFFTVNATISELVSTNDHNGREPIAIIGMAVNMPGAPNIAKLWEVLEQGINTCSEVRITFCHPLPVLKRDICRSRHAALTYLCITTPRTRKVCAKWPPTLVISSKTQAFSITSFSVSLRVRQRVWIHSKGLCCRPHTKLSKIRGMFRMPHGHSNKIPLAATSVWPQTTMYKTCGIRLTYIIALVCLCLPTYIAFIRF